MIPGCRKAWLGIHRKEKSGCGSTAAVSFITSTLDLRRPEKPNLQRQAEAFQNAQPGSSQISLP